MARRKHYGEGMTNSKPLITVDTDNAVVRICLDAARAAGLTDDGLVRLRLDADAVAIALSSVSGAQFRVIHA